jgi:hypothetical protein
MYGENKMVTSVVLPRVTHEKFNMFKREKYEGKWIGRATPKQSSLHFLPRDVRNAFILV